MQSNRVLALWLFSLYFISTFAAAQVYTVTDLGPLTPTAINTWGQVVGDYNGHAFIWTKADGMRNLGTLAGGTFSHASAINDLGVVAGTADGPGTVVSRWPDSEPNKQCSDLTQPFVWTRRNGMQGLGTVAFAGGSFWELFWCIAPFYATGVNELGDVVGYAPDIGTSYQWGFLETRSHGMTLLIDSYQTAANGINNRRQVVGQTAASNFLIDVSHAAMWQNGVMTDLGTLDGPDPSGFYCSGANDVNDFGQVVGWSSTTAEYFPCGFLIHSQGTAHAILWTPDAGMRDLSTLLGDISSVATKANLLGQVIGSSGNTITSQNDQPGQIRVIGRPFIWSQRSGMRDLNALIPANSGWVLDSAVDINLWGQIVGSGTRNRQPHGFLLTPKTLFRF
jgi:probable HAF family extracellular repeat protein